MYVNNLDGLGFSFKKLIEKHPLTKAAKRVVAKQPKLIPLLAPLVPLPVKEILRKEKISPGEALKKEYIESVMKPLSKIDPVMKKHYEHEQRLTRAKEIKGEINALQSQPPSAERDQQISALAAELQAIGAKEKKYMKQGKIFAAIASIVIGVFTFGGGTAAVQSAFEAIKQGAIALGKKILMGAITTAISKGLSKADADKAQEAVDVMEQYPPNPELDSLDAMIEDSYQRRDAAQSDLAAKTGWLVPAGLVTALLLFS
jgi:uncharacterized protein YqeY